MATPTLYASLNGTLNADTQAGSIAFTLTGPMSYTTGHTAGKQAAVLPIGSFLNRPPSDAEAYLSPLSGAVAFRIRPIDVTAIGDQSMFYIGHTATGSTLKVYVRQTNKTTRSEFNPGATTTIGDITNIDAWNVVVVDWNALDTGVQVNGGTRIALARSAPSAIWGTAFGMHLGSSSGAATQMGSPMSDFLCFNSPPDAGQRTTLFASNSWSLGMFNPPAVAEKASSVIVVGGNSVMGVLKVGGK